MGNSESACRTVLYQSATSATTWEEWNANATFTTLRKLVLGTLLNRVTSSIRFPVMTTTRSAEKPPLYSIDRIPPEGLDIVAPGKYVVTNLSLIHI